MSVRDAYYVCAACLYAMHDVHVLNNDLYVLYDLYERPPIYLPHARWKDRLPLRGARGGR